jgi:hypothetical protein
MAKLIGYIMNDKGSVAHRVGSQLVKSKLTT